MAASLAPTMLPDTVALWRHALDAMPADRSPCRYLTLARWTQMRESALDFIDRFGAKAHRLGWTAAELFSVHPEHGTLRLEQCGVLMVSGRTAEGVEADSIPFGNQTSFRGMLGQVFGPPVWESAAKGR